MQKYFCFNNRPYLRNKSAVLDYCGGKQSPYNTIKEIRVNDLDYSELKVETCFFFTPFLSLLYLCLVSYKHFRDIKLQLFYS